MVMLTGPKKRKKKKKKQASDKCGTPMRVKNFVVQVQKKVKFLFEKNFYLFFFYFI